jgi:hypothetical protein
MTVRLDQVMQMFHMRTMLGVFALNVSDETHFVGTLTPLPTSVYGPSLDLTLFADFRILGSMTTLFLSWTVGMTFWATLASIPEFAKGAKYGWTDERSGPSLFKSKF